MVLKTCVIFIPYPMRPIDFAGLYSQAISDKESSYFFISCLRLSRLLRDVIKDEVNTGMSLSSVSKSFANASVLPNSYGIES